MAGGNDGRSIRPPVNAGGDEYLLTISLGANLGASTGVSARDAFRAAHQWVTRQGSPMACPARRGTQRGSARAAHRRVGQPEGWLKAAERATSASRLQAFRSGEMLHEISQNGQTIAKKDIA